MNCRECANDIAIQYFVRKSADSGTLTIFQILPYNPEEICLPIVTKHSFKWKHKLEFLAFCNLPYFIFFISLVEIIFYYTASEPVKRLLIYDSDNKEEIWRFFTYMLLHTDPVHLGVNVIIQGFLGVPLELEQGVIHCATVYAGGGLAGSLGASVFPALSLMAGASGGIYALLLSHIPNTILNYGTIKYAGYRIFTVLTLTIADIIHVCYHVYFYNNERPRIGWVAHASGALAGLLLGFLIFKGSSKWKRKFQIISCILFLVLSVMGVTCIIYSDYIVGFVQSS